MLVYDDVTLIVFGVGLISGVGSLVVGVGMMVNVSSGGFVW